MIITIAGVVGAGKSTVAKLVVKKLGLRHYSIGDFMRQIARERGVSLLELGALAEKDASIDEKLDKMQIDLGKNEDNFVIDCRLGWHFIPKSRKVFLDVDVSEAANRIFGEKRVHESYESIEESIEKIKARIGSEGKRYMDYYGIDSMDKSNYDLVVDTTNISAEEVAEKIVAEIMGN